MTGTVISRKFDDGEAVFRRGEAAASAFEVRHGCVRLSWPGPGGTEQSFTLGAGQVFGAAELISGGAHTMTAEAVGDVMVSALGRDDLAQMFASDPDFAQTLFRPAFERLHREEEAAQARAAIVAPPTAELFVLSQLRLKPAAREVSQQMEAEGIRIASLPFHVGRRSSQTSPVEGEAAPVDLILTDLQPYSLSRRHFAIETHNGGYVVRDCGSHYGTIVNGSAIGSGMAESVAPLLRGENRIIAGRRVSPFRFTLTIEGA